MRPVDIRLAIDAAIAHAKKREARLTSVTLSGADVLTLHYARDELLARGIDDVEVRVERRAGPVRLLAVEVASSETINGKEA